MEIPELGLRILSTSGAASPEFHTGLALGNCDTWLFNGPFRISERHCAPIRSWSLECMSLGAVLGGVNVRHHQVQNVDYGGR